MKLLSKKDSYIVVVIVQVKLFVFYSLKMAKLKKQR